MNRIAYIFQGLFCSHQKLSFLLLMGKVGGKNAPGVFRWKLKCPGKNPRGIFGNCVGVFFQEPGAPWRTFGIFLWNLGSGIVRRASVSRGPGWALGSLAVRVFRTRRSGLCAVWPARWTCGQVDLWPGGPGQGMGGPGQGIGGPVAAPRPWQGIGGPVAAPRPWQGIGGPVAAPRPWQSSADLADLWQSSADLADLWTGRRHALRAEK